DPPYDHRPVGRGRSLPSLGLAVADHSTTQATRQALPRATTAPRIGSRTGGRRCLLLLSLPPICCALVSPSPYLPCCSTSRIATIPSCGGALGYWSPSE